jgi:hypothetical protein
MHPRPADPTRRLARRKPFRAPRRCTTGPVVHPSKESAVRGRPRAAESPPSARRAICRGCPAASSPNPFCPNRRRRRSPRAKTLQPDARRTRWWAPSSVPDAPCGTTRARRERGVKKSILAGSAIACNESGAGPHLSTVESAVSACMVTRSAGVAKSTARPSASRAGSSMSTTSVFPATRSPS